jgi:hypothetical protein
LFKALYLEGFASTESIVKSIETGPGSKTGTAQLAIRHRGQEGVMAIISRLPDADEKGVIHLASTLAYLSHSPEMVSLFSKAFCRQHIEPLLVHPNAAVRSNAACCLWHATRETETVKATVWESWRNADQEVWLPAARLLDEAGVSIESRKYLREDAEGQSDHYKRHWANCLLSQSRDNGAF